MPINRLLKEGKFRPEDVERLNRAFALALSLLGLVDRNDPICELVARKIIEVGARDTLSQKRLPGWLLRNLAPRWLPAKFHSRTCTS